MRPGIAFRLTLLFALFMCLLMCDSASSADWPYWRGVNRNAVSTETDLIDSWENSPPALAWRASGIGKGYSSVVISKGRVFTTGRIDSDVYCFSIDLKSGRQQWKSRIGETSRNVMATPTVHGDLVYAIDPDGDLSCLRVTDGKPVWSHSFVDDFGGRLMSSRGYGESPLIDGDQLICTPGGAEAMIVALDRLTGEVIWKSTIPDIGTMGRDGAAFSSIVISEAAGIRQYVQLVGRGLVGIEAETGNFLWGYNAISNSTANIPTPIIRDDFVFSANGYHAGGVLLKIGRDQQTNEVSAKEVYRLKGNRFQNHHGGFVLIGDHIYGGHGSNNGLPTCIDFNTGKLAWKQRGPGTGSASIVAADGDLYFHYQDGTIALIEANPEDYRLKGTFQLPGAGGDSWSHPVVADGKLFLREQDSLSAYDLRDHKTVDSPGASPVPSEEFEELARLGVAIKTTSAAKPSGKHSSFRFALDASQKRLPVLKLSGVHINDNGAIDDTVISEIQQLKSRFAISVTGTDISESGIRQLAGLKQLTGLNLAVCRQVNDRTIKRLASSKGLRVLIMSGTDIGSTGLTALVDLPELVALDLEVCDNVTDESCDVLGRMKNLRSLNLKKTAFEPDRISAEGLKKLSSLQNLESLNLYANAINNETLKELAPLMNLRELDLSLTSVTDAGLEQLGSLKKLTKLTLLYSEGFAGPKITNAGLSPLSQLEQLRDLNLVGARITDAGVDDLRQLQNLRRLTVSRSQISPAGVRNLQKALPECDVVSN